MNANAEHFIAYFVTSPWMLILALLGLVLIAGMIKSSLRLRRERRRALREKEYWRRKFESELPEILHRNRQIRELTGPEPVPLLNFEQGARNESYVLSDEVLGVNSSASTGPVNPLPNSTSHELHESAAAFTGAASDAVQPTTDKDDGFDVFNLPHSDPNSDAASELDSEELFDRKIRIVR